MTYQEKEQVTEEIQQNIWYLDIGCNNHICENKTTFSIVDESYQDSLSSGRIQKLQS